MPQKTNLTIIVFGTSLALLSVASAAFFIVKIVALSSSNNCVQFCGAGQELGLLAVSLPALVASLSLFIKKKVTLVPIILSGVTMIASILWFIMTFFNMIPVETSEKNVALPSFIFSVLLFSALLVKKSSNK